MERRVATYMVCLEEKVSKSPKLGLENRKQKPGLAAFIGPSIAVHASTLLSH